MYFYCTYFDHRYLPKGLALYESLCRHCTSFRLWVLCLDRPCFDVLKSLNLPHIEPILLEDFECGDTSLAQAKRNRTLVEYYFTCTPSLPLYIFKNHPDVNLITYLDSDLFFFSNPYPIYQELEGHSIGIIEHRFPPKLESLKFNGIYNVGWVSFRNDAAGLACLNWWRDRCNEWCHDYHQDGKFADQKYLDDWVERFNRVAVLQYPGVNIAPWNLDTYPISLFDNQVFVADQPAIFFHFHGLKELEDGRFDLNVSFYHVEQINDAVLFAYQYYIATLRRMQAKVEPYLPEISLTKTARFQKIPATQTPTVSARSLSESEDVRHPVSGVHTTSATDDLASLPFLLKQYRVEPSQLSQLSFFVNEQIRMLQNHPSDGQAIATLREIRRALTGYLLNQSVDRLGAIWHKTLSQAHRAVWQCGLKNEVAVGIDQEIAQQIRSLVQRPTNNDVQNLPSLLAAMLYFYPHEVGMKLEDTVIPNWAVPAYMEFMFESPRLFKQVGEVDQYHDYLAHWTQFIDRKIQTDPNAEIAKYFSQVYTNLANLTPSYFSQREQVQLQTQRAQIIRHHLQQQGVQLDYQFPTRSPNRKKIRLGILSLNFAPSAETFTVLPIFEQLDRSQFEIYLYAFQSGQSDTEKYCRQCVDRFTHLTNNQAENLVHTLRSADLDILLIGSNITARSYPITLISMHRLARVQVIGASASVTTAMPHLDYYIGGTLTTPIAHAQRYYTEQLVTVEGSGLCFSFPPETQQPTIQFDRQNLGISATTTLFISGANFRKINPELRETWAKVLAQVPDSILVIYPFGPNWGLHPHLEMPFFNQLQATLQRHGVDLKRLLLIKTMPSVADVRHCLAQADIYLDSFPYSGAASAIDPLLMGLPIVALEGQEQRERQASSLLRELGIPELVTQNEQGYLNLAQRLGCDRAFREQLCQRVRSQMAANPAFLDRQAYAQKMGAIFTQLFQAWQTKQNSQLSQVSHSSVTPSLTPSATQGNLTFSQASTQVL